MKPVLEIDGARFDNVEGFYDEVTRGLGLTAWGHDLDGLNAVLRGGFGTPTGGFVLRWKHSDVSRAKLASTFDVLVEIIRNHGLGGVEAQDSVDLELA